MGVVFREWWGLALMEYSTWRAGSRREADEETVGSCFWPGSSFLVQFPSISCSSTYKLLESTLCELPCLFILAHTFEYAVFFTTSFTWSLPWVLQWELISTALVVPKIRYMFLVHNYFILSYIILCMFSPTKG